jgi:hypothetical protein
MKVSDLLPSWGKPIPPEKPKIIIANRAPCEKDALSAVWWYDRIKKIMYRATANGYVKD